RIALCITRHHLAATADPLVAAILAADAVLDLVVIGPGLEMLADGLLHVSQVIGMDALVGVGQVAGQLPVLVTEDGFPAARVIHLAGDRITVPDPGAAALDGQRHAFVGLVGGVARGEHMARHQRALDGQHGHGHGRADRLPIGLVFLEAAVGVGGRDHQDAGKLPGKGTQRQHLGQAYAMAARQLIETLPDIGGVGCLGRQVLDLRYQRRRHVRRRACLHAAGLVIVEEDGEPAFGIGLGKTDRDAIEQLVQRCAAGDIGQRELMIGQRLLMEGAVGTVWRSF
ncbi:conserved hypothetical protein, partial [Ricinus communis]